MSARANQESITPSHLGFCIESSRDDFGRWHVLLREHSGKVVWRSREHTTPEWEGFWSERGAIRGARAAAQQLWHPSAEHPHLQLRQQSSGRWCWRALPEREPASPHHKSHWSRKRAVAAGMRELDKLQRR